MHSSIKSILAAVALSALAAGSATAQNVDKINKWFDAQKGRTFEIQKPGEVRSAPGKLQAPGTIQTPGAIQTPGNIQIPRGIKAIKQSDEGKCEHRYVVGADALFDFDKAFLNPRAEQTLKALGPMLAKEGQHEIKVEGHTDGIGTDEYNQDLSERRANAVQFWLVDKKYIKSATVTGFGKKHPIAPNTKKDGSDNPSGRQLNRRVEVVVDRCKAAEVSQ
ncbi:MAG TPA: OmpA family protein [Drouetiella sp.]|jgi:outer membrane protein OmpA-like peptidoglycan-associated protein